MDLSNLGFLLDVNYASLTLFYAFNMVCLMSPLASTVNLVEFWIIEDGKLLSGDVVSNSLKSASLSMPSDISETYFSNTGNQEVYRLTFWYMSQNPSSEHFWNRDCACLSWPCPRDKTFSSRSVSRA